MRTRARTTSSPDLREVHRLRCTTTSLRGCWRPGPREASVAGLRHLAKASMWLRRPRWTARRRKPRLDRRPTRTARACSGRQTAPMLSSSTMQGAVKSSTKGFQTRSQPRSSILERTVPSQSRPCRIPVRRRRDCPGQRLWPHGTERAIPPTTKWSGRLSGRSTSRLRSSGHTFSAKHDLSRRPAFGQRGRSGRSPMFRRWWRPRRRSTHQWRRPARKLVFPPDGIGKHWPALGRRRVHRDRVPRRRVPPLPQVPLPHR